MRSKLGIKSYKNKYRPGAENYEIARANSNFVFG
jgi:hypothetical protein